MIEERARVTAVVHDAAQPTVLLEVERKTACGLCGKTQGCGNKVWGSLLGHSQGFSAHNAIGATVGQAVIVAIDEKAVMHAALLLYFVPLVLMLIIAALCQIAFQSNAMAMLGAIVGLSLAWRWMKGFLAVRPQAFSVPEVVRFA